MIIGLETEYAEFKKYFEDESLKYFTTQTKVNPQLGLLWKSMQYTFFLDGKRFRPFLCFLSGKTFKASFNQIFPFALAVELIHTYSLIHDDLPCLDNDDIRRGQPTNHKVFGEDIALLAGDALLTEAFSVISHISADPKTLIKIIQLLAQKIGPQGMVGGQVLDMKVNEKIKLSDLEQIHLLKTANLIEAAVVGAALLSGVDEAEILKLSNFAMNLGIAFQIKDDLLDGSDSDQNYKNYIQVLGHERTQQELKAKTQMAIDCLKKISISTSELNAILQYNINRLK